MLTITRRDCRLGAKQSSDVKESDTGEQLRMLTFEIEELMLDERELNCLLSEPHAHQVLFNTGARPVEPYLKCLKALELKDVTKGAYVELAFGLDATEIKFADCTLSKIRLEPRVGGKTSLSCKVTTASVLDDTLPALFEQFGKDIECELRAEPPGAQQDLPLSRFEGDTPPETLRAAKRPAKRKAGNGRTHARH